VATKVLLDEGLPARAAALLRERGVEAVHLTEIASGGTADEAILETAQRERQVIVTLDADFHALLALRGWRKPSVIRIRREGLSAADVAELVMRIISEHAAALESGAAISVRQHLVGVRTLPLVASAPDSDESG
jgi:predicted nuclease of predicted toxin-antitoxin system